MAGVTFRLLCWREAVGWLLRSKDGIAVVLGSGRSGRSAPRLFARSLRFIYLGITGAILLIAQPAHGQFTASIKTNTINGVVSNWVGNGSYIVGSNTFKDVLQIINSGVLSNGFGILGYETSASNNVAIVNNGTWRNQDPVSGNLFVGNNASGNQLIVTNGGTVFSHLADIGGSASSSNNVAVVTGSGSVWSNQVGMYIGVSGAGQSVHRHLWRKRAHCGQLCGLRRVEQQQRGRGDGPQLGLEQYRCLVSRL